MYNIGLMYNYYENAVDVKKKSVTSTKVVKLTKSLLVDFFDVGQKNWRWIPIMGGWKKMKRSGQPFLFVEHNLLRQLNWSISEWHLKMRIWFWSRWLRALQNSCYSLDSSFTQHIEAFFDLKSRSIHRFWCSRLFCSFQQRNQSSWSIVNVLFWDSLRSLDLF